jgi:putative hydrolase of the HAD superfamily
MPRAVIFDFYGTLAHASEHWLSIDAVLSEHGYELPEEVRTRWWFESEHDGLEHVEHSTDRETYQAWQRERLLGMLAECDVHPGEYEIIVEKLRAGNERRVLVAYPEVAEVLAELQTRGLTRVVCSNWDWDLAEALEEAGLSDLVDVVVSSAWAGARKPHPRIFEHTLAKAGLEPSEAFFVGDTWGPDVVGPSAMGIRPVYLLRADHWPDPTAPDDPAAEATCIFDLRGVLDLVDEELSAAR